jgi:hypothetical protein
MHGMKRGLATLFGLLVLVVIVLFVIQQPNQAGDLVTGTFHGLGSAAASLGTFLGSLTK